MSNELLRNGGFERGNYDFWGHLLSTFEIQSDEKKFGSYASKLTMTDDVMASLFTKDYIPVSPLGLYKLTLWMKNTDDIIHAIGAQTFDSDYNAIGGSGIEILGKSGIFDWAKSVGYFTIDDEASYIRIVDVMLGLEGTICYHDSMSLLQVESNDAVAQRISLLKLTNINADATAYSQEHWTGAWRQAEYHLYCTSLTGTTPTLNVTIQGYDPSTEQWKDVMVFQELDDAGSEFKTLLSGLGWKQRAKYTTAGTVTDCDFTLGVVYKR